MNVRNCRKCGKMFNYVMGVPMCPACKDAMEEVFQGVKKYVQEHKGASINDVAEACEVEAQQIRQWIREERLEFSDDSMIGIACEKCGTTIKTGRFCEKCKASMATDLNSAFRPAAPKPIAKPDPKDNRNKMRFI